MAKTKQQLKDELANLEKQEKFQNAQKDLKEAVKLVGICKSSHTFSRIIRLNQKSNFWACLERVNHAYLNDNLEVRFNTTVICINITNSGQYSFEIYEHKDQDEAFPGFYSFKYDIALEKFNYVLEHAKVELEYICNNLRSDLIQTEFITMGDHRTARTQLEYLQTTQANLVEITNSRIKDLLIWEGHPFVWGNYLLINDETKAIIQLIINKFYESARIWGGRIAERDLNNAKLLNDFLKII